MAKPTLLYIVFLSIPFVVICLFQEISSLPTVFGGHLLQHHQLVGGEKHANLPQWDDLDWAWGKRSDNLRPQWEDLGWSWGKRAPKRADVKPDWYDLGWTWG